MPFENLSAGTALPEFHVSAPAPTEPHENKIHEDDLARQYGFKGGVGSRVTVVAWRARPGGGAEPARPRRARGARAPPAPCRATARCPPPPPRGRGSPAPTSRPSRPSA